MKPVQHDWQQSDLIGGHQAIDFANTVSGWGEGNEDWLVNYARFAQWARLAALVDEAEYKKAMSAAVRNPLMADRVFAEANELRIAFVRLLHALKAGNLAKSDDLTIINHWIRRAAEAFQLRQVALTLQQDWSENVPALQKPLLAAARTIGHFLAATNFDRLKICPGRNCAWFFVDLSKNHSRRWCDMATCGNLAKARQFQNRRRPGRAAR
jgi:predicted RNA-binding Zn ribbon-like protein